VDNKVLPVNPPDGWSGWSNNALRKEFVDRVRHFYGRVDGSICFPNNLDGDTLKIAYLIISSENKEGKDE
jgi:hypothetical protein